MKGHYAKAGVEAGVVLQEFPLSSEEVANFRAGSTVSVEIFSAGQLVDVTGTSKGKGFAGAIKRHNFSSNRASHGNSVSHNAPEFYWSTLRSVVYSRVKRMAGHLGNVQVTTQNLEVVRVDAERGLILIKGAIPRI